LWEVRCNQTFMFCSDIGRASIRVMVMKELREKYNMRKIDASTRIELTTAAITQYFKGERGAIFIQ